MAKLSEIARQPTERVILWGPPGIGKTRMVGQLAEEGFTIHYFDLENGVKTLYQCSMEAQDRINYYKIPDTTFNPISAKFFLAMAKLGGRMDFCEEHATIGCPACKREAKPMVSFDMRSLTSNDIVVIEGLNALQLSAMYSILKETQRQPDTKPEWDDWRRQGQIIESICSFFQQCNTNVIMTSHAVDVMRDDKYDCTAPIGGSANVSANITKFFDHSVLMRQEGIKTVLHTSTAKLPKFRIKSRHGIDLSALPNATLMPLFTYKGAGSEAGRRQLAVATEEAPAEVVQAQEAAASSIMNGGQKAITASSILANLRK